MSETFSPEPRRANFGSLVGKAAQLAQKQAALTAITSITLPKLYHTIGKRIATAKRLPDDLMPFRDRVTQLESSMISKPLTQNADVLRGFAARAKHIAAAASEAVGGAAVSLQLQAAYATLGKEAVERYGHKAIPKDLADEYNRLVTRRDNLKSEVGLLASAPVQGVSTSRRLVIAGVLLCLVLGAAFSLSASFRLLGSEASVPPDASHPASRMTADLAQSVNTHNNEVKREKERMAVESRNRDLQERESALLKREHDLIKREHQLQRSAAHQSLPSHNASAGAESLESKFAVEITGFQQSKPFLLVDNGMFFTANNNTYQNLLIHPSHDFPDGVESLSDEESDSPKSMPEAVAAYSKAVAALQKCPLLARVDVNERLGDGRFLANWQGITCVLKSSGTSFTSGKSVYVPVTCTHVVSYTYRGQNYSDIPYLLQAGDVLSDDLGQARKYREDLQDELVALLRAGQWLVYYGVADLPHDAARLTDAEIAEQVSLKTDLPRAKELVVAICEVVTGSMTRDAPALNYAFRCANRAMLTDAASRSHATATRIDAKDERLTLPAAAALQWTVWFQNPGSREKQLGMLRCLQACGADWEQHDDEGRTPLMHAMLAKQPKTIAFLCENGLGVTKPDSEGRSPLMRALMDWNDDYAPLMSLTNGCKGADRNGDSVLHYCDRFRHIPVARAIRLLVEQGASLTVTNNVGDTPLHVLSRAAVRDNAGREFVLGEEWSPFVRFLVSKGADGGIKNMKAESPISILVGSGRSELATGLMFPSSIVFGPENNGLVRQAIALKDKAVLAFIEQGNSRTKVTKRDLSGMELASCVIEGDLDKRGRGAEAGEADSGKVFIRIIRGRKTVLVVLTPALKVLYETPDLSDIERVAFQPDGAVVALAQTNKGGRYLFKADASGKVVWSTPEQGPLKGSPEDIHGARSQENVWVGGDGGLFALCASQGSPHPCSVMSFNGDGKELLRLQPFAPDAAIVDLRGVLPDGSILYRDTDDPDEVILVQPRGKEVWRKRLGTCTSVLRLDGNDVCVGSVAGREVRLTRISDDGMIVWEAVLRGSPRSGMAPISLLQEGKNGLLFASSGEFLSVVTASGKVMFVAKQSKVWHGEVPRIYDDGTIVWPDDEGGFIVGNYLKW